MVDNTNSSDRLKNFRTVITITASASILFVCLYLIRQIAIDLFLRATTLLLFVATLSLLLEFASVGRFVRLWVPTSLIVIISSVLGFIVDSVPLISTYCGPECGASIRLKPFAITTAIIIGTILYSIPQLRVRRWLRVALSFLLMGSAISFGLSTMVN